MKLHAEIMNINVDGDKRERVLDVAADLDMCDLYNYGHRDGRHQAAEVSLKWERYIEMLESKLEMLYSEDFVKAIQKECGV